MSESAHKAPSIRSVASNSSLASQTSQLSRRPRIRGRSKTITGAPSVDHISTAPLSELPYLGAPMVQGPVDSSSSSLPMRPPRSPRRLDEDILTSTTPSSRGVDLPTAEATMVEPLPSPLLGKPPKATELVSSSPVIQSGYKPPPSAFQRDPAFTPNIRDSVSTQQSDFSSSLYPLSTSAASGPDSPPSPRSMSNHLEDSYRVPIAQEVREVKGFDGDDVAYRLQLLVKNNYFLPPAHSKPSAADFAAVDASAVKKPAKSSTPAFLDIFRTSKTKAKSVSPTSSPNPDAPPMLRTTGDSITTGHPQPVPRNSTHTIRPTPQQTTRGRVVVVREKMADITVAAKQAEQELKAKGVDLVQIASMPQFDNVIDPTDAVDIPLPAASYPFAVQASALHGLGVQDSLGAAVLADRLPPKSSNTSFDPEDDWRKALLHQAVHHSLDNTPDVSTFSHHLGASTPVLSGRMRSNSHAPTPTRDRSNLRYDAGSPNETLSLNHSLQEALRTKSPAFVDHPPHRPPPLELRNTSHGSGIPARVETPVGPFTPLAPPPSRKNAGGSNNSNSQNDLTTTVHGTESGRSRSAQSYHTLRKARSSPMLSDSDSVRFAMVMTPPPLPTSHSPLPSSRIASQTTATSYDTMPVNQREGSISSASYYSDDYAHHEEVLRSSLALSAVHGSGRPSLSEYSQSSMSPTTSVFQDALNHRSVYGGSTPSLHGSRVSLEQHNVPLPAHHHRLPRRSTATPPPRMSSSLAHVALPPPPRTAHLYQRHPLRTPSIASSVTDADSIQDVEDTFQLGEPEPTTPPLDGLERPRDSIVPTLILDTPRRSGQSVGDHSNEAMSFFDSIQSQPNALDDLESSSDEEEEEEVPPLPLPSPRVPAFEPQFETRARTTSTTSAPVPRSTIMKFGNHSLPYVSKSSEGSGSSPYALGQGIAGSASSSKVAIGNVPAKPQFFSDRKSDSGHPMPSVTYGIIRENQDRSLGVEQGRPTTSTSAKTEPASVPSSWRTHDAFKKLDGMLLQHMEAEKDTIKRIATTVKQASTTPGVPSPA